MTDDEFLRPNRDDPAGSARVSRRLLLAGSAAAGITATAGCSSDTDAETTTDPGSTPDQVTEADTVFVFNTGDRTMSVIDVASDAVVATPDLGLTASFPANQYAPDLTDAAGDPLWLNVDSGVSAVAVGSLSEVAAVETGSGANWQEVTPDGAHLVVSAREPAHKQVRLDADPDSDSFGTVTAELDRTDEGGRGANEGPGPCDVTVHPDGEYAYVPDLYGDTLTVIDIESFEIGRQVDVPPVVGAAGAPWMATAAPDGETLLVEHSEGATGTESVWDTSDPAAPEERRRLTGDDGLGERPLTSEIGPDSATGYVFTPGTEDVTVVDLDGGTVTDHIDLGGSAFVGTWGPNHEKLYVPVQSSDEVKVIDHERGAVTATIAVGSRPYGATAGRVRPSEAALESAPSPRKRLKRRLSDGGTTYCIGNCACGHRL
jgi:YVTN family beta-propeller protein